MDRRRFLRLSASFTAALSLPILKPASAASLPSDLTAMTALELSAAIRTRQASCVEVMSAYLDHIHRYNPVYNAIVSLQGNDDLIDQARRADQALASGNYQGWMHGMPQAVKDLTPVAGIAHTSGSPIYADRIADADSAMVARIRRSGAIFIGKTNTPEFGLGSQTYNAVFGATGSAWNPDLTAGGSSGGAASGLGTHMLPVADGSDMMGSLRNPGAFNNVVGFRPSANLMSEQGGTERPLSTSGPMGRNTRDTLQFLQTIAPRGFDIDFAALDLRGKKIGWLGNLDNYLAMEPGITGLCESSLNTLTDAGANVEPVQPGMSPSDLWQSWTTLRHAGRSGYQRYFDDPAQKAQLKPELIWEIEQSMALTETDLANANRIREAWYGELERLFANYDFLVLPSSQVFPYPKEITWPRQINGRPMDTYHRWMEVVIPGSLGGIPVLNVPVGFDNQGRPMGMQIMGRFGADQQVLAFGLAYEAISSFLQVRPRLVAAGSAIA